jgi:hypothetical protein
MNDWDGNVPLNVDAASVPRHEAAGSRFYFARRCNTVFETLRTCISETEGGSTMSEKKEPGLKSALDLAMERLEKKNGKITSLSDEQKKALAEIDGQLKAKIAEIEILKNKQIAEAGAKGDAEEVQRIEAQKLSDIGKARSYAENDKERVRGGT